MKTQEQILPGSQSLDEFTSNAVVEGLLNLAEEIAFGVDADAYNASKLWFHQLCRRIQKHVEPRSVGSNILKLSPYALLFVELLSHYELLDRSEFDHCSKQDVEMLFEIEWENVKLPEGETFVTQALRRAKESPRGFAQGGYGLFLDIAFQLQEIVGESPICIPTSERTASIIGISGKSIALYVKVALKDGFLKVVSDKYVAGKKARTFLFDATATIRANDPFA